MVLPFGLCKAPTTFQREILSIFLDLISEGLDLYMDDFTPYVNEFEQALQNLEKIIERCVSTRLCLSNEKFHMMMTEGVVLGHYIFVAGIQVDLSNIEVILMVPTPLTQIEVRNFLGYVGYYHQFIEQFSKIVAPLYVLTGNVNSNGLINAMFLLQILRSWSQQPMCYEGQIGTCHSIFQ